MRYSNETATRIIITIAGPLNLLFIDGLAFSGSTPNLGIWYNLIV